MAEEPIAQLVDHVDNPALPSHRNRWAEIGLDNIAAPIEKARIDNHVAAIVDDLAANSGVGQQPMQNRASRVGCDRKIKARLPKVAIVGISELIKPVRVDNDGGRISRGRACNSRTNDLALDHQTFHPGIDQALAELVEVKNAARKNDQAENIDQRNARGKAARHSPAPEPAAGLLSKSTGLFVAEVFSLNWPCGFQDPIRYCSLKR